MERVLTFSMERILVQDAFKLTRNFGVPLAFYFAFYLRSSNTFPVRLLLSSTVDLAKPKNGAPGPGSTNVNRPFATVGHVTDNF